MPPALRSMAGNSGWLLASSTVQITIGVVTAVWLTRYLGPERFGVYSYVIALVGILVAISSLGMASLVTRELVNRPDERDRILGSAVAIRLIGGCLATVVLVAIALLLHNDPDLRLALIIFGLVLLVQPLEITATFYESRTQSRYLVWVQIPVAVLYVVTILIFIAAELSVIWFLVARLGQIVLGHVGLLLLFARQGLHPGRWRADTRQVRALGREGWPLALSAVGAVLYLRIDQVMLGQMVSASEVGIYAAAARLSEFWYFIPTLIVASAFPYLLRLRSGDQAAYDARIQQLFDLLAWLGLMVAVGVSLMAPWLVGLLFGPEFSASAAILAVHVWAGVFIFMRAAFSKWLIAERLLIFSLVTQGAGAVMNIGANLVLIPVWGGIGAAWATVFSYATASYLALWLFPSTRPAAIMMTRAMTAPVRYARTGLGHA
jgi:O-antigen/teichoic acid export membrane protein